MATKRTVRGWIVQFTLGEDRWGTALIGSGPDVTCVDDYGVFLRRRQADLCMRHLRGVLAPGTRFRIRRATVTLQVED